MKLLFGSSFVENAHVSKSFLYQTTADIFFQLILAFYSWGCLLSPPQQRRLKTENAKQKFSEKSWAASVPIPTFMFLWAYIFPRSVCLFSCRKFGGPILGKYIDRSPTHECGNWDWGLFWGYINRNFFAVLSSEGSMKNPPNSDLRGPIMMFPVSFNWHGEWRFFYILKFWSIRIQTLNYCCKKNWRVRLKLKNLMWAMW